MTMIDNIWRLFCSLRLTAWLIAWLTIGAFAGMFVDQTLPFETHVQMLDGSPLTMRLFALFELHNVFGSWWFMGLVVLLSLNLIACTLERLPMLWREVFGVDPDISSERLEQMRSSLVQHVDKSTDLLPLAEKELRRLGASVRTYTRENGVLLVGVRQRSARFAAVVIHVSLLIIMFGHVGNTLFGLDAVIRIDEGSSSDTIFVNGPAGMRKRAQLDFAVRCDDFRLETFVGGRPKDYESDLVVLVNGNERKQQTIRVNTPLEYADYTFYQSSYQQLTGQETVQLQLGSATALAKTVALEIGQRLDLADGIGLVVTELSSGMSGRAEAVRVLVLNADGSSTPYILFKGILQSKTPVPLTFIASQKPYATILSVARAPFTFLVFIGFAALIAGTLMATLMSFRRYWILIQHDDSGQHVVLAGQARKQQGGMRHDLEQMWQRLDPHCVHQDQTHEVPT